MGNFITRTVVIAAVLFTLAACGGGSGGKAVTPGESMPNPPIVDNADGFPTAAARSAATTYGTICYSVRFQSGSRMSGCQTQGWEDRELRALRYGEFVVPMSETDLRDLYTNARDERGFLRNEVAEKVTETALLALQKEGSGGTTLRDLIEFGLISSVFRNLVDGGEFGNGQEMQYQVRFCANARADNCRRSATAASWEANAARAVFQPTAR